MTGESAAGIFVSINRIITKILYPKDPEYNTILFFSISIIMIFICSIIHTILLPRSDFIHYYIFLCNQKLANDGARIMHQINENVSLVNMYHNQESTASTSSSTIKNHNQEQSNDNLQQFTSKRTINRPSIFSTESNSNLDTMLHSNQRTNNNKIQNMLRTDSTEFVMPFGIDDEEILEENFQQTCPLNDLIDVNNNNDSSDYSIAFKQTNTTTLISWLHSLETSTHFLYYLRRIFRRIRKW